MNTCIIFCDVYSTNREHPLSADSESVSKENNETDKHIKSVQSQTTFNTLYNQSHELKNKYFLVQKEVTGLWLAWALNGPLESVR